MSATQSGSTSSGIPLFTAKSYFKQFVFLLSVILSKFCSAVHNVDRACISVLSQVIRNVNEKKNRTDKYDFLREPWRWDSKNFVKLLLHKIFAQKSIGMPGEQEYHICLYDFSFSSTLIKTCGRTLISALHNLRKHHKICYSTVS